MLAAIQQGFSNSNKANIGYSGYLMVIHHEDDD